MLTIAINTKVNRLTIIDAIVFGTLLLRVQLSTECRVTITSEFIEILLRQTYLCVVFYSQGASSYFHTIAQYWACGRASVMREKTVTMVRPAYAHECALHKCVEFRIDWTKRCRREIFIFSSTKPKSDCDWNWVELGFAFIVDYLYPHLDIDSDVTWLWTHRRRESRWKRECGRSSLQSTDDEKQSRLDQISSRTSFQ